jgi:hypothetical protein
MRQGMGLVFESRVTINSQIETLVAKQAITEVLYRYCPAIDRIDPDLASRVWHPGGLAHYGYDSFEGTGADFMLKVLEQHAFSDARSHQITNITIDVDGDRATSEAYVTACIRVGPTDVVVRGRYADAWSCRAGEWLIDERTFHHDLTQLIPVDETPLFG